MPCQRRFYSIKASGLGSCQPINGLVGGTRVSQTVLCDVLFFVSISFFRFSDHEINVNGNLTHDNTGRLGWWVLWCGWQCEVWVSYGICNHEALLELFRVWLSNAFVQDCLQDSTEILGYSSWEERRCCNKHGLWSKSKYCTLNYNWQPLKWSISIHRRILCLTLILDFVMTVKQQGLNRLYSTMRTG